MSTHRRHTPPNPSSTATRRPTMSSSVSPQLNQPEPEHLNPIQTPESETSKKNSSNPPSNPNTTEIQENSADKSIVSEKNSSEESIKEVDGDEEEEEGECGFCLFMKGGGCKDTFVEWEECVEEGEKNKENIVEKCFEVTSALKKCMEAHSDYYAPLLDAEKAAQEDAKEQLEEEKARTTDQESGGESEKKGNAEPLVS